MANEADETTKAAEVAGRLDGPVRLTRNEARATYDAAGLTYAVITDKNLQRLRGLINQKMKASELIKGTYRCHQRPSIRRDKYLFAQIKCKSFYFSEREAVTFNSDGFIGFAGWADDNNVQPILSGFVEWVQELQPNAGG